MEMEKLRDLTHSVKQPMFVYSRIAKNKELHESSTNSIVQQLTMETIQKYQ
jgi:hypothetical protein